MWDDVKTMQNFCHFSKLVSDLLCMYSDTGAYTVGQIHIENNIINARKTQKDIHFCCVVSKNPKQVCSFGPVFRFWFDRKSNVLFWIKLIPYNRLKAYAFLIDYEESVVHATVKPILSLHLWTNFRLDFSESSYST